MPEKDVSYLERIAKDRAGKGPGAAGDVSPLDRLSQERAKALREEPRPGGLIESGPETAAGAHGNIEPRPGHLSEQQPTTQALELTLISASGDAEDGIPWGLYAGRALVKGPEAEELIILFSNRVVTVWGRNLNLLVQEIRQGHLHTIQQHNSVELQLLEKEDPRLPRDKKKSIIARFAVEPDITDLKQALLGREDE